MADSTAKLPLRFEFHWDREAPGKILVFFDVHYGPFTMLDFKIVEPNDGGDPWVAIPSRKANRKWRLMVLIPDQEQKKDFEDKARRAYHDALEKHKAEHVAAT